MCQIYIIANNVVFMLASSYHDIAPFQHKIVYPALHYRKHASGKCVDLTEYLSYFSSV